jgi:hypothetical protein
MFTDVVSFLAIIVLFVLGFGTALQVLIYPDTSFTELSLTRIFFR